MNVIEGRNLTKIYGKKENQTVAINHMDISVKSGEYLAITGASGSGKSTLLHLIGGLESYTDGTLMVCGKDLNMNDEALSAFRRQNIGFIYQQFHLFPQLTVYQNIVLPAMIHKNERYEQRAVELLEYLDLSDKKNALPSELSGGQQQRTEPTGNLDSASAEKVKVLLEQVWKTFHITLIVVTHDLSYAQRAERRIEMCDGRILA